MNESEFLKVKLDFAKSLFTMVAVSFAGLLGYLTVNFTKNGLIVNCLTISAIILLGIIFLMIIVETSRIFKSMKGLIK